MLRRDVLLLSRVGARGEATETRLSPSWLRVELFDRPAAPVRGRVPSLSFKARRVTIVFPFGSATSADLNARKRSPPSAP